MSCYHPIRGFRDSAAGRVYFGAPHYESSIGMRLPCGGCDGCRRERARQWAMRCLHEASLHDDNCFVTLTYDDEHLPGDGSVDKSEFQRFLKRVRRAVEPRRFSFYHVGEYGSRTFRPHYHALFFGLDFGDKFQSGSRSGWPVWRSSALERLWQLGRSELGSVTFESVSYVARYLCKKGVKPLDVDCETGEVLPGRAPEYSTMSRRPAIGAAWIKSNLCDVYPRDGVAVRGKLERPPRYYDGVFEACDELGFAGVREVRRSKMNPLEGVSRRLLVRERCAAARERVSMTKRGL